MAQTNVQAFSGDVEISSNLAVDTSTLFVDSVGNKVGIGTANPDSIFQVGEAVGGVYGRNEENTVEIYGNGHSPSYSGDIDMSGTLFVGSTQGYAIGRGGSIALGGRSYDFGSGNQQQTQARISGINQGGFLGALTFETHYDGYMYERMRIDQLGRVGIGVDAPRSPLTVFNGEGVHITSTYTVNSSQYSVLDFNYGGGTNSGTLSAVRLICQAVNRDDGLGPNFDYGAQGKLLFQGKTNNLFSGGVNDITYTDIMTVDGATKSVGIGLTDPTYKLDILDNIRIRGNYPALYFSEGTGAATQPTFRIYNDGASQDDDNNYLAIQKHTTGGVYDSIIHAKLNGLVGIGTNNPNERLYVSGNIALSWSDDRRIIMNFDNDYRQGIEFDASSRGMTLFSTTNDSGGTIIFKTRGGSGSSDTDYGTERMRIKNDGNVGIGTANPVYKLQVNGTANHLADFQGTQASCYISAVNSAGTRCYLGADGAGYISTEINSGGIYLYGTGNINYYTNGARRAYLSSAGVFNAQGFGIYSDERIKDNITDVDDEESLEIIKQLQPKNFVMRENRDVKRWGFIAQDVEQLVPEMVSSDSTSKLYIKKKYEIINYNPPVKLSDVVYSNVSVAEYATLDANTQAHYTGPDSGNTYYSNIVSEAVYSKSNVSARITDEVFDIGECVQLSNDETYSLNVCCVHVTSVSNDVYVFQDNCIMTADDKDLIDINPTDYIYVKSKDIDNVKTINHEFIHPTLISAVQQIMRNIDRLTERVTVLENR